MTENSCLNCVHAAWNRTKTEHHSLGRYEPFSEYGRCNAFDYTSGGVISRAMPRLNCPFWESKIKEKTSMTSYDHLVPTVDAEQSTVRIYCLLTQVLPADMHKLILHALTRAEEMGEERGKGGRK